MSAWLASLRNTIALTRLEPGPLSAMDTIQVVRELAHAEAAQPSLQEEQRRFHPSSQHAQAPGSGICPERFGAWLFSETNGHPYYLRALLQEQLERGLLVPRLIAGSGWVFEPQPSILEAALPDTMLPWDVREMIQQRLARLRPLHVTCWQQGRSSAMTSPLRNFARLPGWLRRTDLSPWMRPCRTSCC